MAEPESVKKPTRKRADPVCPKALEQATRAKAFAIAEWKRLNERLSSEGRTGSRIDGQTEAALTVSKYAEQVNALSAMLDAVDQLKTRLKGDSYG